MAASYVKQDRKEWEDSFFIDCVEWFWNNPDGPAPGRTMVQAGYGPAVVRGKEDVTGKRGKVLEAYDEDLGVDRLQQAHGIGAELAGGVEEYGGASRVLGGDSHDPDRPRGQRYLYHGDGRPGKRYEDARRSG